MSAETHRRAMRPPETCTRSCWVHRIELPVAATPYRSAPVWVPRYTLCDSARPPSASLGVLLHLDRQVGHGGPQLGGCGEGAVEVDAAPARVVVDEVGGDHRLRRRPVAGGQRPDETVEGGLGLGRVGGVVARVDRRTPGRRPARAHRARAHQGQGAELLHHAHHVHLAPALDDLAVDHPIEADRGDVDPLAAGRDAVEVGGVGAVPVLRTPTRSPSTTRSSMLMYPSGKAVRQVRISSIRASGPIPIFWPPAPWTVMLGEMISWAMSYLPCDQPSSFHRRTTALASSGVDKARPSRSVSSPRIPSGVSRRAPSRSR